jgi:transposase
MIGPGNGVRVFLAAGTTDMRCGVAGLCARAKKVLGEDPASRAVFAFRGRMGDRPKILHRDGQGFCLCCKVLGRGYFLWPKATEGKIALTPSQMAMLWEGIDWRQPHWTSAPTRM